MNKLEEYRNNSAIDYAEEVYDGKDDSGSGYGDFSQRDLWENRKDNYIGGFDAAIALHLPVKFGKWKEQLSPMLCSEDQAILYKHNTWEKLYQYWLDNIFKLE